MNLFAPISSSSNVHTEQIYQFAVPAILQLQVIILQSLPFLHVNQSGIEVPDSVMVCHDDSFGPFVYTSNCKRFDFSLRFEDAIFAILPNSLFLLMSIVRLVVLYRRPPKARWSLRHSIGSVSTPSSTWSRIFAE
jgi:hypothetical protein